LADVVPPPWKHRYRYHGVFALNHKLSRAVTALAVGDIGKRCDAATRVRPSAETHGLLRHTSKAPLARHVANCFGQADGAGEGISA